VTDSYFLDHFGMNHFIRLRRMHEMQTIATDVLGVCPSVCQSVCHAAELGFTVQKPLERIKTLFWVNILCGPRNTELHAGPDPIPTEKGREIWGKFCQLWPISYVQNVNFACL